MKKALAALTAFVMVFGAGGILSGVSGEPGSLISASADTLVKSGECGDNAVWTLDDEGTLTISGTGEMNDYAYDAPWGYGIKKVVIESGITNIGCTAFGDCSSLTSVTIPDSVTSIGRSAFNGCSRLTSVTIPNGVKIIDESAFEGCKKLESVTIPDSVESIGFNAFFDCTAMTSATLPMGDISIGEYAIGYYYYQPWESWDWYSDSEPDGPRVIENFKIYCYKDSAGEKYAVDNGFDYELLASIPKSGKCGENATWALDDDGTLTISGTGAMDDYPSYSHCPWGTDVKKVVIEDGITSIGTFAFALRTNLTSVTIPESVTSIGNGAFGECTSLKSITIPDSVTSIGYGAFYRCMNLTNIKIPDGVTSIGQLTFWGCTSLTNITIPNSVTSIETKAFSCCTRLTSVSIPDSVLYIGDDAFNGCVILTDITIPNSVTTIGSGAFKYCMSLTSITIPDSVTNVGNSAFYGCTNLNSVTIPDSVTSIEDHAFGYIWNDEKDMDDKLPGFKIYCYKDSAGEKYAIDNEFDYELIENSKAISECTVTLDSDSFIYDGTEKTPEVTVKDGENTLTNGTDYTVSYSDNTEAGTAAVTITGIGIYSGTKTVEFTISPSKAELTGDTNGDGSITVTDISKIAAHVKGKKSLTPDEQKRADANGDGSITVTDISKVAAHVKGVKSIS